MDYPPVPPGCKTFDPRRLRRHARKQRRLAELRREQAQEKIEREKRVADRRKEIEAESVKSASNLVSNSSPRSKLRNFFTRKKG